jgi:hypothetical protein
MCPTSSVLGIAEPYALSMVADYRHIVLECSWRVAVLAFCFVAGRTLNKFSFWCFGTASKQQNDILDAPKLHNNKTPKATKHDIINEPKLQFNNVVNWRIKVVVF